LVVVRVAVSVGVAVLPPPPPPLSSSEQAASDSDRKIKDAMHRITPRGARTLLMTANIEEKSSASQFQENSVRTSRKHAVKANDDRSADAEGLAEPRRGCLGPRRSEPMAERIA